MPNGENSFKRASAASKAGWHTADLLGPSNMLGDELAKLLTTSAIVMLGTNDTATNKAEFHADLERVVDAVESAATVSIMSTVPDRRDYPGAPTDVVAVNDQVRAIAASRSLPSIDLYAARAVLPERGLCANNVHSSSSPGNTADFTP